jgi:hypothetical protein
MHRWFRALALLGLCPSVALAHDWYPVSCCSDKDCRALLEESGETVRESAEAGRSGTAAPLRGASPNCLPTGGFMSASPRPRRSYVSVPLLEDLEPRSPDRSALE